MSTELNPHNFEQPELQQQNFLDRLRDNAQTAYVKLGRIAVSGLLVAGGAAGAFVAEQAANPSVAYADTTSKIAVDNDYPYGSAKVLNAATYDWWIDENGNGAFNDGEQNSPLGFGYRNCVDGAAYWAKKYDGVTVPSGWGNAKYWATKASAVGYTVKAGSANNIEPGDIAQSDDGDYGHVGFVTGVVKNAAGAVIEVDTAEYNHNSDGTFTTNSYTSKNSSGNFIRAKDRYWENFIDLNGVGTVSGETSSASAPDADGDGVADTGDTCPTKSGLSSNHGCPVQHVYTGMADGRLLETYWGAYNALTTWQPAQVGEPITSVTDQIGNDMQHIFFGTQGGELWEAYWGKNNSLTQWEIADLNSPIDSIASQTTPDGTQHVYAGTDSGVLNESYWGPNNALTTYTMANTGSPVESLSSQLTTNSIGTVQHVFSGTADGKLRETYVGGGNALTTSVMANEAAPIAGIDSAIDGSGNTHIFSSTTAGKSYDTYWGPHASLTNAQMANLGRTITSMAARYVKGVWHIYNGGADGNIWDTYWGGGNSLTTAPLYNMGYAVTKLSAEAESDGTQHIYTVTENGKEQETYLGGGNTLTTWQIANLGSRINAIASDIK